jgi:hypothetical protein
MKTRVFTFRTYDVKTMKALRSPILAGSEMSIFTSKSMAAILDRASFQAQK